MLVSGCLVTAPTVPTAPQDPAAQRAAFDQIDWGYLKPYIGRHYANSVGDVMEMHSRENRTASARIGYSYDSLIDHVEVGMAPSAILSSKFQISIPKAVREEQHWQAGQEFVFIPKGKGVLVMPVPELEELEGIAKGARKAGWRDRGDRY